MNRLEQKQPFIVIMYGPTGVGKTDLALSLAESVPAEIINMDVGSFYTPFSIGTAKPDWKQYVTPHHLFDFIDNQRNYTVMEYRSEVYKLIRECIARGKVPIIVGGSAFYLHALLFPPHEALIVTTKTSSPIDYSWDTLYAIDPQRAACIAKNDTYRIARALDIWTTTGTLPSSLTQEYNPVADFLLLYVGRDTHELNERIANRVSSMMQHGWIEETQQLVGTAWSDFIRKKKLIGYNEIVDFLAGQQNPKDYTAMTKTITYKTKQYAKRQRTFWRKIEREIKKSSLYTDHHVGCVETVNLTNTDLQLYSDELSKRLMREYNE